MIGGDYEVWAAEDEVPRLLEAVGNSKAFPFDGSLACLRIVKKSGPNQGQVPSNPAACRGFTGARAVFLEEEEPNTYPREVRCQACCSVQLKVFHTVFYEIDDDLFGLQEEISEFGRPHKLVLGTEQATKWSHHIGPGEGPGGLLHQTEPTPCIRDVFGLREVLDGVDDLL